MEEIYDILNAPKHTQNAVDKAEEIYEIAYARATSTGAHTENPLGVRVQTSFTRSDPCIDLIDAENALKEVEKVHRRALLRLKTMLQRYDLTDRQRLAVWLYYGRFVQRFSKRQIAECNTDIWKNGRQVRTDIDNAIKAMKKGE